MIAEKWTYWSAGTGDPAVMPGLRRARVRALAELRSATPDPAGVSPNKSALLTSGGVGAKSLDHGRQIALSERAESALVPRGEDRVVHTEILPGASVGADDLPPPEYDHFSFSIRTWPGAG